MKPPVTKADLPEGVAARIDGLCPPAPDQFGNASTCIHLMHTLAVEIDAQSHRPIGRFPLSLATLLLNTDGSVSTGWSATTDLKSLYHLMWACETLRDRLSTAIDECRAAAAKEEDAPPSPPDNPAHEQPAHSTSD
jgi:hypothetical protein